MKGGIQSAKEIKAGKEGKKGSQLKELLVRENRHYKGKFKILGQSYEQSDFYLSYMN